MMGAMLHAHEQVRIVNDWIAGLQQANVRAVISLSGLEEDKKPDFKNSDDIFFLDGFIPHHWLFPQVSGVVHHGGAGTTHTGLLYGLPTLVLPFGADQPFNGDRVFINKLGPSPIPIREVTSAKFAQAVKKLVEDKAMEANAQRVGAALRKEDGVGTAASVISDLLAGKDVRAPVTTVAISESESSE